MDNFEIIATQTPGVVSFSNYEEVKEKLQHIVTSKFKDADYENEGLEAAIVDFEELAELRKSITDKQKELEKAYSAPYKTVDDMLKELVKIVEPYYKNAKNYVDEAEKEQKRKEVMAYATKATASYGEVGEKIVQSAAFFKKDWLLKKYTPKKYQDEIDEIVKQAVKDINSIQATGGENTQILLARYYETLSMDGVKSFMDTLKDTNEITNDLAVESDNNVLGYKVLKITATEDQMASLMNQLEMMGLEVEEIEDGMPKVMEELLTPEFDSFVAFDIETTGSYGASNGDGEAQITEIGAVKVVNGEVVAKFDQLANPGRKITSMVYKITHITDDMLVDKPPVSEVIKMFREFVGDSILVGHNIKSSDLRYITKAANKAGVHFDGAFLDTYLLAKKYKDEMGWEKVNLPYLAQYYGFEHKEAHRAWSDAEVNAEVYFELQKLKLRKKE